MDMFVKYNTLQKLYVDQEANLSCHSVKKNYKISELLEDIRIKRNKNSHIRQGYLAFKKHFKTIIR